MMPTKGSSEELEVYRPVCNTTRNLLTPLVSQRVHTHNSIANRSRKIVPMLKESDTPWPLLLLRRNYPALVSTTRPHACGTEANACCR